MSAEASSPATAATAKKNEGNKCFARKDWDAACKLYTEAIELDPSNHVFYSNRSAAYCEKGLFEEAEADGFECLNVAKTNGVDFVKAYYKISVAQLKQGREEDAKKTVQEGLEKQRSNPDLNQLLREIKALIKANTEKKRKEKPWTSMIGTPHGENTKGVTVTTIAEGDQKTFPKNGDHLEVHYIGVLRETGDVFDFSRKSDTKKKNKKKGADVKPFTFTIGNGDVIRGWEEGLLQMTVGERALLSISAAFAYGSEGCRASKKEQLSIPPNSALIFEVELLRVSSAK